MFATTLVLIAFAANADDKPDLTPKQFRSASWKLIDDPTDNDADDMVQAVITFVSQSMDADVTLDDPILGWVGDDKKRSKVLLAAYVAGNAQSQLNSGVNRDDVYSGVLSMIAAYRKIQEVDKNLQIKGIDKLVKLYQDAKLVAHCGEVEKAMAKPKKKEN